MPVIRHLHARASDSPRDLGGSDDTLINLLLGLLGLAFFSLILVSVLFLIRRVRRQRALRAKNQDVLAHSDANKRFTNSRALTIETMHNGRSSVFYINQKDQPMLANPDLPPYSPDNVPEIHITFPDEHDDQGRPQSGRVLVVRIGDNSAVGLEPMNREQLPAYEKVSKDKFYSIDMDQIGGLKEKEHVQFQ